MQLRQLLPHCKDDITISRMVDDSRHVEAGDVFVFDKRLCTGVEKFIADAKAKGAVAIVSNIEMDGVIYHAEPNQILAKWAKTLFPKTPKILVAVTGTNGKTSTAWFYAQIMNACGVKAGSVGTLGVFDGEELLFETGFTAPTPLKFHEGLHKLAEAGVEAACVEVSSHALVLNRADGVRFKAAALTNITQDHLDFHKTMEAYAVAKYRLFDALLEEGGQPVINIQRPESLPLVALCKDQGKPLLSFGSANAELVVSPIEESAEGLLCKVKYGDFSTQVKLPLLGMFQAQNVAAALGLVLASGVDIEKAVLALENLKAAPGRMEIYGGKGKPVVVVDYAHTPDALATALKALKPLTKSKLWVVFGAGGDRDSVKRPLMGQAAHELADEVVVTDDNPRTENADAIRTQIIEKAPGALDIADRTLAINTAIEKASADDVVLVAGKGHENGQIIGKTKIPFDDREVVRNAIDKL